MPTVYESFQDKGFVMIGVARENRISDAERVIQRHNFPWKNLVDLRGTEKVWEKYGLGNSGGAAFLIDENGIIVAINPTAEEARNFLIRKFQ
jgi:peroxiredoxin